MGQSPTNQNEGCESEENFQGKEHKSYVPKPRDSVQDTIFENNVRQAENDIKVENDYSGRQPEENVSPHVTFVRLENVIPTDVSLQRPCSGVKI